MRGPYDVAISLGFLGLVLVFFVVVVVLLIRGR